MKRRRGYPVPLILFGSDDFIQLSTWEITRGELESYDAYAALVAYNPDWATIPGQNPSITTIAFAATGYQGALANDAAATSPLTTTHAFTLTKLWGQGGNEATAFDWGSNHFFRFQNEASNANLNQLQSGDTFTVTVGTTTYTFTVSGIGTSGSALDITVDEDTNPIITDTANDASVSYAFSTTVTEQNASYFNTTASEFRKTTDGGSTWTATPITDATLANNANAVFVPPDQANTSVAMRSYLDTGENYNAANTYYFYNNTEIREVSSFSATVAAVVKLTNYMLKANTPSELSFDSAGVMSGTLPLTSRLGQVRFMVDVSADGTKKVRIPVLLTPFSNVALEWDVQAGTDESFSVDIAALQAYGVPLQNLQLSPLDALFTLSDLLVSFSASVDYTDTEVTHVLTGTVRANGENVPITLTVTIAPGPQLPSPAPMFTPGNGYGTVTWEAVTGAVTYSVYYRAVGAASWIAVEREDPTSLSQLISPLTNDVTYQVQVFALSPDYRDSEPQTAQGKPTSPPAYFTWLTGTSAFMVNGKTWVLSSTTQTQTWIIGNETFVLNGDTWLIS